MRNKIKIACVGDSITFGSHLENREEECYPAWLQKWLGSDYDVRNFGVGGCTLIRKGEKNVWQTQIPEVKVFNPNIIIVMLGGNDTRDNDWKNIDDFYSDYCYLVDNFQALPSEPELWLCASTSGEITTPELNEERLANLKLRLPRLEKLRKIVIKVATEKGCGFIDMSGLLAGKPEMYRIGDGGHPNKDGARTIAKKIYDTIK